MTQQASIPAETLPQPGLLQAARARLPSFLILGAQKSGTTWLADVLARQPGVFIPRQRELHFFTRRYDNGPDWYASQFADAEAGDCLGEATPNYLAANYPEYIDVPRRIRRLLPDARFVVLLRDPVQRALSAYMHHVVRGRLAPPAASIDAHFEQLLMADLSAAGVIEFGLYATQLEAYFDTFDRSRFLILSYEEDLCRSPAASAARVLDFVGAPQGLVVPPPRGRRDSGTTSTLAVRVGARLSYFMKSDDARMRYGAFVQQSCRILEQVAHAEQVRLGDTLQRRMRAFYRPDGERLRKLLGAQAPSWAGGRC